MSEVGRMQVSWEMVWRGRCSLFCSCDMGSQLLQSVPRVAMPGCWPGWEVALTGSSQATVMPSVSVVRARFNGSCNGSVPWMVLTPAATLISQPCQPWRC